MATEDMSEDLTASSSDAELDMDFEEVGCDGLFCMMDGMLGIDISIQYKLMLISRCNDYLV
jgi:hypothetical protein